MLTENVIKVPLLSLEPQRRFDGLQVKAATARAQADKAGREMKSSLSAMLARVFPNGSKV
jgi:hypothetical protein